jgi:hypothetical protein
MRDLADLLLATELTVIFALLLFDEAVELIALF